MTTTAREPQAIDGRLEAIQHLEQSLAQGQHWFIGLLEAMSLWTLPQETVAGCTYHYLVAGEAFDWLLLAQRLIEAAEGQILEAEVTALLFEGKPPLELTPAELRRLLGTEKYRTYLNYFYGITVEEALILAVAEEARKKWWCRGLPEPDGFEEAFRTLYAGSQKELWEKFCAEKGFRRHRQISLYQLKEFTYWLFKRRLGLWDKARIASDTKKGLENLHRQRQGRLEQICS